MDPVEWLEDPLEIGGGDPGPTIRDLDDGLSFCGRRRDAHRRRGRGQAVPHRVVDEVRDDPTDVVRVRDDTEIDAEGQLRRGRIWMGDGVGLDGFRDDHGQVDALAAHAGELVGFGQEQQVARQPRKAFRGPDGGLQGATQLLG